jgi:hypothetical protein
MVILGNGMTHSGAAGTEPQRRGDETTPGDHETSLDGREKLARECEKPSIDAGLFAYC